MKMMKQRFTKWNKQEKWFILLAILMEVAWCLLFIIPWKHGVVGTPPGHERSQVIMLFSGVFLMALYAVGYVFLRKKSIRRNLLLGAFFVFSVTLVILPELGSADICNYVMAGRIMSIHQENPYLFATAHFIDPVMEFNEKGYTHLLEFVYGPLWAMISALVTYVGKSSFFVSTLQFKLLGVGSVYISAIILQKLWQGKGSKNEMLYLVLLNPLILFEAINNAHNDMLMMCLVIAAYYFLQKRKYIGSGLLLGLSILVKYTFVIFIPLWAIFIIQKEDRCFKKIGIFLGIMFFTIGIFYIPFWEGVEIFSGVIRQSKLFYEPAMAPLHHMIYKTLYGIESIGMKYQISKAISVMIFFLVFLFSTKELLITRRLLLESMMYITLAFLLLVVPTFPNWYVLWVVPFLFLLSSRSKTYFWLAFLVSLNSFMSYGFAGNSSGVLFLEIVGIGMLVYAGVNIYKNKFRKK